MLLCAGHYAEVFKYDLAKNREIAREIIQMYMP